jgi:murein DD-endopeptidase MepM/ murein hydrolase activator NlpD
VFEFLTLIRPSVLAGVMMIPLCGSASAFDYSHYLPADLDAIAARKPSGPGVDVLPLETYRFDVTLVSQAAPCPNDFLKWAMPTSGVEQKFIDNVSITKCIRVKSAKGRPLDVFIQDQLADSFAKEVPPGGKLTLYAMLIYLGTTGPGIVVNDFNAQQQPPDPKQVQDCGCGRDFHSGVDFDAPEGTPVSAMDDGIVVRAEQDEAEDVDVPSAGKCGRYVVIKHSYRNGHTLYSRYAQLGRLVGADGKPITAGQHVKAKDKIGEVGGLGRFHFEMRPVDPEKMDARTEWTQRYGTDASMDWSRYQAVDPQKFDDDAFAGRKPKAATTDKK